MPSGGEVCAGEEDLIVGSHGRMSESRHFEPTNLRGIVRVRHSCEEVPIQVERLKAFGEGFLHNEDSPST